MSALHKEVRSRLDSRAMLTYKIGINLKSQFGLLFRGAAELYRARSVIEPLT
jgi:hypothetical protein